MNLPNPRTIETYFLANAWKGDTFISTKSKSNLMNLAISYNRKVHIHKCILITDVVGLTPTSEIAYKITILDDNITKRI